MSMNTGWMNKPAAEYRREVHRPTIHCDGNEWRIGFEYMHDSGYSFIVVIKHHLGVDDNDENVRVFAMDMGDRLEVVSPQQYAQRVQDIVEHEEATTHQEAREYLDDKLVIMREDSFWKCVKDCRDLWNAMVLFSPSVTLG